MGDSPRANQYQSLSETDPAACLPMPAGRATGPIARPKLLSDQVFEAQPIYLPKRCLARVGHRSSPQKLAKSFLVARQPAGQEIGEVVAVGLPMVSASEARPAPEFIDRPRR